MKKGKKLKVAIILELFLLFIVILSGKKEELFLEKKVKTTSDEVIKWVDFDVSCEALQRAYELDVETHESEIPLNWIELLAYVATIEGGKVESSDVSQIEAIAEQLRNKETSIEELKKKYKTYHYYLEAYQTVLAGLVGEYKIEEKKADGTTMLVKKYGLKAFSPIAKGFPYQDYDDFGVSRSFGYKRAHLGHDMMGQIGTPLIAVETGTVEALGWNKYGGWRIGIRSQDKKRYYYYAHLRQNYPYAEGLKEGSEVQAGDVIGYMGHTGYSNTENVNNIDEVHLHFGIQLIFDESQKEGTNEIWIDCYQLTQFLRQNQSEVKKIGDTREWKRVSKIQSEKRKLKERENIRKKICSLSCANSTEN